MSFQQKESSIFTQNSTVKLIYLSFILFLFASCAGDQSTDDNLIQTDTTTGVVDSLAYYKEKLKADASNPVVIYARAQYYLRHAEIELAQADLESILAKDSTNLKAQKLYADISLSRLDLETSKYHYEYILKKDSTNTGALIGLGKIYSALGRPLKAIFFMNEALKEDPYLPEPYFIKGLIYRADYYARVETDPNKEEQREIALSSFQTAVEQDPNYYSAYIEMGVMYDEVGDSIALEYYNSALDIFPESIEAWYNKGMYYQNRGEVDNALHSYYTLNKIDETWADPYYNIGYIHMIMTDDLDSAIYYFERSTELDPTFYQAYNNLGLSYEKKDDRVNAKRYYLKAIEINPDFQLAKDNLNALQ
jgi:tetratricopeptide (TPR) repeat protein